MLVKQDAVKLLEAFNASVTGLLREISDKLEVIEKNDPDPDVRVEAQKTLEKLQKVIE